MGYVPKRNLYKLIFEDPDLEGLEVTTRPQTIDSITALYDLAERVAGMDVAKPDIKMLRQMAQAFAPALVSWNVEEELETEDGQTARVPVPATADGLCTQEITFLLTIINAYVTAMTQAPPPLPAALSSGGNSPEESTPGLASQSRSLPSS